MGGKLKKKMGPMDAIFHRETQYMLQSARLATPAIAFIAWKMAATADLGLAGDNAAQAGPVKGR